MTSADHHRGVTGAPDIVARGLRKSYGGVQVLSDVAVEIAAGEIHGLVGENGAGKSTLLKILAGAISPDAGEVRFDGERVTLGVPRAAIARGISLITQEGTLVPAMSVRDNVFLARWSNVAGIYRARDDRRRYRELLDRTGFDIDPDERVDRLPFGAQQQVEILRALARGARVLAMDEPTAVLTEAEKAAFVALVRRLADSGVTVILVSHFLDEVLDVAHRVTILRDGRVVHADLAANQTPATLVRHMAGREVDLRHPAVSPVPADAAIRLSARGLGNAAVHDLDLDVRAGEIVGIAGLVGSGRSEALHLLFGADRAERGTLRIGDRALRRITVRRCMAAGVALVPESRKTQGLVMSRSITENVALASLGARRRGPFVARSAERRAVRSVSDVVDIRAADRTACVETLSGGNQQKALFAKWLVRRPEVLLVDEPTRGVDVAAKGQIHRALTELAADGVAVVCVSSDIDEVLGLAHRVVVLRHGTRVAEFARGAAREEVLAAAFADDSTEDGESPS